MWVRLRCDVSWSDLAIGLAACTVAGGRTALQQQAQQQWSHGGDTLACLSVRTGFDLLLRALRWSGESEVLLTALTVPDMARIVRRHGLAPVPVDLVPGGFVPCLRSLERALTPATRAIVVAHLFGGRVPMEPIVEVARRHGLLVVEDCAQAYHGPGDVGHGASDVALFSFGPIKTATALGGAVVRVADGDLLQRMRDIHACYPVQRRRSYLGRLFKYSVLKAMSARTMFRGIAWGTTALGGDLDALVNNSARNFPAADFFRRIRRQPSAPLLSLMLRRWRRYDPQRLATRRGKGELLRTLLDGPPTSSTHWVFPVLSADPEDLVRRLRRAGFDATRTCRMQVIDPPDDRTQLAARNARATLSQVVFLPWYPELPDLAIRQMASILRGRSSLPIDAQIPNREDQRSLDWETECVV